MSYIYIADPHPGRCPNLRHSHVRMGEMLRCLDYANQSHVCTFEAEVPRTVSGSFTITASGPKPWVKP